MTKTPDLENAYGLEGTEANRKLYADWAESYDSDFAQDMDYQLHAHVARGFAEAGGQGPVLDLGAGTGLCGAALAALNIHPLDATDLSPQMLQTAQAKGVYRRLFEGNLLERLPIEDGAYQGAVSSGTFTHGHVGPEALGEVLRILAPGGLAVLSVNAEHWQGKGFAAAFDALSGQIDAVQTPEKAIYGARAQGPHAKDTALIVSFRKAQAA